jgi:hypothetical protein
MKKLEEIKRICEETITETKVLADAGTVEGMDFENGRAELAEQVLEILNGVQE